MTCAKQVVTATLIAQTGERIVGTNACNKPQEVCPRDLAGYSSGEGYHMCKVICEQNYHAEEAAILEAEEKAKGSIIYLTGHTYACNNCKKSAREAGVLEITIGEPPL